MKKNKNFKIKRQTLRNQKRSVKAKKRNYPRIVVESRFAVERRNRTIHARMREYLYELKQYEIDSMDLLSQKGYCLHWPAGGVCNTGDTFLTELSDVSGDVVDMEAYAQALVCRAKNVPFISVKYVTDIIGQNSVKHWEDKLADARKGLGEFFEKLEGV